MAGPTDPSPGKPVNGDTPIDANPVRQRLDALYAYLTAPDLSTGQAKSVLEAQLADIINPRLRDSETLANYIVSGLNPTAPGPSLTMTTPAGTAYINGYRVLVASDGSHTYSANQDTYVDVDQNGGYHYVGVANAATSGMALTPNSVRVAKVITNGTQITRVLRLPTDSGATGVQELSGLDPLGNAIYPTNPQGGFSMVGLDAASYQPTATTIDVPGSTLVVNVPFNCWYDVTVTGLIQANQNVTLNLILNLDGNSLNSSPFAVATGHNVSGNSANDGLGWTASRRVRVRLAAGFHTLKLVANTDQANGCNVQIPGFWGTIIK